MNSDCKFYIAEYIPATAPYNEVCVHGKFYQIWKISDRHAERIDRSMINLNDKPHITFKEGFHDRWDDIEEFTNLPRRSFYELEHQPGQYFPRMARPVLKNYGFNPLDHFPSDTFCPSDIDDINNLAIMRSQLNVLLSELDNICQYVHPDKGSMDKVYGNKIRNLLIISCTEVESCWKGVLKKNFYNENEKRKNKNLIVNDYRKLCAPMRLNEYKISFPKYPWIGDFAPFTNWSADHENKVLNWYSDYNKTKHDREKHFSGASLENAFLSTSALFIMLIAQYGITEVILEDTNISSMVHITEFPKWDQHQYYCPILLSNPQSSEERTEWSEKHYFE
ncbi:hypothetical protein [Azospirillum sp. TSH100]|uniref:hypothetical protein n=1 Tax=Azospirillum sp. TSH100 TaxID=652764 RepID=UPI0010A9B02C|nr:hypothetical protein [Azospirillum sp. TSH100]QCG89351.1 hypothetical protein E6C72_16300 [Azospirillum sp. TSH100]